MHLPVFFPRAPAKGSSLSKQPLWYICRSTSSHFHICRATSSHLDICRSTSSHLHICRSTSSHFHICRLHRQTITSADLLSLFLSFSRSSFYLSLKAGAVPPERHKTWQAQHFVHIGRPKPIGKIAILRCPPQPFRAKWTLNVKKCSKIAILRCPLQPFRKNWGKIAISRVRSLCVKVCVCKSFCVYQLLRVKASVCKGVCVCKSFCV